jgi:serine/threonine protein phosphatase 1
LFRSGDERPSLLEASRAPDRIYAIGDVHGCLDRLRALEDSISMDAAGQDGENWIVQLGDLIDRGPHSAQVIDHLLKPAPAGFTRFVLRGNHEQMLLNALQRPDTIGQFLATGGDATLHSYGLSPDQVDALPRLPARQVRDLLTSAIPVEHVNLIESLPHALTTPGHIFVHAGLRPGRPLARQSARDLLWIREEFTASHHDFGAVVVHGHTPAPEPVLEQGRIGLDTGCFATGRLTAVRLVPGQPPVILQVAGSAS